MSAGSAVRCSRAGGRPLLRTAVGPIPAVLPFRLPACRSRAAQGCGAAVAFALRADGGPCLPSGSWHPSRASRLAPPPRPACSNVVQGSKEQKAALDLLLQPENAGKARPQLVAACAFALG